VQLIPRHSEILKLIRRQGRVEVEQLCGRFGVSAQTIRKDLEALARQHHVVRFHGGAMLPSGVDNLEYEARRQIAAPEKEAIGRAAARLIPDNSSLFINVGTTTEAVGRALHSHRNLMIIADNVNLANRLRVYPQLQVIIAGGVVRSNDGAIVGEAAVDFVRQFKVDYAIIGVSAIDADGGLFDFDFREVKVVQAIMQNARHVVLTADASKFERSAPVRIAHLSQVHTFITDRCSSDAVRAICDASQVTLVETAA
jgi:DeoR family glycerol-3-phosphate regulon repressor